MEARVQPLAAIYDLNTDLLVNCTEELTDAQANQRLEGGGNSIAFLIAHVTDARHYLTDLLGAPLANPVGAALAHVQSIEEVERLPPLDELLSAWEAVGAHLSRVLRDLTGSDLDGEVPQSFPIAGGTGLDAVAFLAQHESYHVGQMAFLRRQWGLPAMRYDRRPADPAHEGA